MYISSSPPADSTQVDKRTVASPTASEFENRLAVLTDTHAALLSRRAEAVSGNGIFERYLHPVLTAAHVPLTWRYDLDGTRNPSLLERMPVNAVFNPGAIKLGARYVMVPRIEGVDRKSFFAVAESANGLDGWRFGDYPIRMPETHEPDVNVYDMRLTLHEDGWIYGVFCTERKDGSAPDDPCAAIAQAGIARTRDLVSWTRLPDLRTPSRQQRNVVLHPEFVDGKYAFYTRPQDGFIDAGSGGGIGWALCDDIERAEVCDERIVDARVYHTIKEAKNGQGPPPIKTDAGWLHLAHAVRNTAAGLRYVLYLFLTALDEPWRVIAEPAGYLIAPEGDERVGDVSNVVFSCGWIADDDGTVFIYYASSDTRIHVATSSVRRLLDHVNAAPADGLRSAASVEQRMALIRHNLELSRGQRHDG